MRRSMRCRGSALPTRRPSRPRSTSRRFVTSGRTSTSCGHRPSPSSPSSHSLRLMYQGTHRPSGPLSRWSRRPDTSAEEHLGREAPSISSTSDKGDPMLKGFKDFIMRGNVVDLAVAVIIAGAFGKVIGTFVTVTISFLIVAAAVYFMVVAPMNHLAARRAAGVEPEPEAPSEEVLLL